MSGKNRSQKIFMAVVSSRLKIPEGTYSVHLDDVKIVKGSLSFSGRIIDELRTLGPDNEDTLQLLITEKMRAEGER